ncbi:hypothetical protein VOLCADRAFT_107681 [Volvox carteri f. nagariensis]|uniref:Core domain-containing protein n=1 Tax=Volvox carteri f. nagariensis TaxID=3068 RepID=D8UFL5_VOLCA|nr:uncharacterized protein VOLCADRAFT_107681 [Volvox carteri f. nagariensis]EFJ41479.1 hypothetical protein VOLCADRAFT_107681 [Volvox carteri f. nagariensis]|eukprot:XP_002957424.1 hypothetical protein VOLCADRAFT_107681 [Volvox carteri f. nagariensis]
MIYDVNSHLFRSFLAVTGGANAGAANAPAVRHRCGNGGLSPHGRCIRTRDPSFGSGALFPWQQQLHLLARLRELQAENPGGSGLALRVEVEGGGCSGFQYKFKLEEATKEDDMVFECEGGRVVCDVISLEFLRGAVLEFEDSIMRSAFTISKNPNAEASCGCGSSFAAKMK